MKFATYTIIILFCWTCWAALGWLISTTYQTNHFIIWLTYAAGTALLFYLTRGAFFLFSAALFGYLIKFLFWLKGN